MIELVENLLCVAGESQIGDARSQNKTPGLENPRMLLQRLSVDLCACAVAWSAGKAQSLAKTRKPAVSRFYTGAAFAAPCITPQFIWLSYKSTPSSENDSSTILTPSKKMWTHYIGDSLVISPIWQHFLIPKEISELLVS